MRYSILVVGILSVAGIVLGGLALSRDTRTTTATVAPAPVAKTETACQKYAALTSHPANTDAVVFYGYLRTLGQITNSTGPGEPPPIVPGSILDHCLHD